MPHSIRIVKEELIGSDISSTVILKEQYHNISRTFSNLHNMLYRSSYPACDFCFFTYPIRVRTTGVSILCSIKSASELFFKSKIVVEPIVWHIFYENDSTLQLYAPFRSVGGYWDGLPN
jgi:hypothetical protein